VGWYSEWQRSEEPIAAELTQLVTVPTASRRNQTARGSPSAAPPSARPGPQVEPHRPWAGLPRRLGRGSPGLSGSQSARKPLCSITELQQHNKGITGCKPTALPLFLLFIDPLEPVDVVLPREAGESIIIEEWVDIGGPVGIISPEEAVGACMATCPTKAQ
jgi:hypothetical protein